LASGLALGLGPPRTETVALGAGSY
jgi:hypothetical protein